MRASLLRRLTAASPTRFEPPEVLTVTLPDRPWATLLVRQRGGRLVVIDDVMGELDTRKDWVEDVLRMQALYGRTFTKMAFGLDVLSPDPLGTTWGPGAFQSIARSAIFRQHARRSHAQYVEKRGPIEDIEALLRRLDESPDVARCRQRREGAL